MTTVLDKSIFVDVEFPVISVDCVGTWIGGGGRTVEMGLGVPVSIGIDDCDEFRGVDSIVDVGVGVPKVEAGDGEIDDI